MDYHSIHGHDIASFDISNTHRLPTVSASQAWDELGSSTSSHVSTGLEDLDHALLDAPSLDTPECTPHGGVKRGQVTEVWGPPGTGKTALGIQIAANALRDSNAVVWVDCFQVVRSERLARVVQALGGSSDSAAAENLGRHADCFIHYTCHTLPHFIALISRPTAKSIPTNASVLVVNALSALINSSLPKSHDGKTVSKPGKGLSASSKRLQALQAIMNALQKLAATRNCAVVLLSQCATKMQSERGATLIPAVNATVWEQGISTRLVLFRDWVWQSNKLVSIFLTGFQKLDGKATRDGVEHISGFKVEATGLSRVPYDPTQASIEAPDLTRQKRKLGQTDLEVPDSEDDEDYGWADEDEAAMPAPPPQWQGSEDILLGQEVGRSDDDSGAEEEDEGLRENGEGATLPTRGFED